MMIIEKCMSGSPLTLTLLDPLVAFLLNGECTCIPVATRQMHAMSS